MRASELSALAKNKLSTAKKNLQNIQRQIDTLQATIRSEEKTISTAFSQFADTQLASAMEIDTYFNETIQRRLDEAKRELDAFQRDANTLPARLSALDEQIEQCEQRIRDETKRITLALHADPQWQRLNDEAVASRRKLEDIKQTHDALRAEYHAKHPEYLQDPAFAYLYHRGFGSSLYHAMWPFSRFDSMLANAIRFKQQKSQFDVLALIKNQLDKGFNPIKIMAEKHNNYLLAFEDRAFSEAVLVDLKHELNVTLSAHDTLSNQLNRARNGIIAHQQGKDQHTQSAHRILVTHLQTLTAHELQQLARKTVSQSDDHAINIIIDAKQRIEQLLSQIQDQEREMSIAREVVLRAQKMDNVIDSLNGYSANRYRYSNARQLDLILTGVILGNMSIHQAERELKYAREVIPPPEPTPTINTNPWGTSDSLHSTGSSIFSTTDSVSRSSGGFSTTDRF